MSREYDNTNRGALFKNENKESSKHPDYKGSLNVDGKEFWLDAWINEIRTGEKQGQKFMSVTVKPKMAREHQGAARNPPAREPEPKRYEDLDDDIPF